MIIDAQLLADRPEIIQGLLDGSLTRFGSVIRHAAGSSQGGQIVAQLLEAPGLSDSLKMMPLNPMLGSVPAAGSLAGQGITIAKLSGIQQSLTQVLGLTQIAAGASVLNLGVSLVGFGYMAYKLNQVQKSLGQLQQTLETGFNQTNHRLDQISGQLNYLTLMVEDSRHKQQSLAQAIGNLHKALVLKEIASLQAELASLERFPDDSSKEAIKIAAKVRNFLGGQAMQSSPELEAELILNTDLCIQGWAVATTTEANLLMDIGYHQEARQLLAEEAPKLQQVAQLWSNNLLSQDSTAIATSYRYGTKPFRNFISPERLNRITQISPMDQELDEGQRLSKKDEAEVEFQMTYAPDRYNQTWFHTQIAIAEYLDSLSELTARVDSLENFATLCQDTGVKSRKELLPDRDSKAGFYLITGT